MNEFTETAERPIAITVICVLGFIGALLAVPMIFSPVAQQIGSWYPIYIGLTSLIGLVCMIGLWMMKKWAVYTYTGLVALNQIVLLAMGLWSSMALLMPAVVIFFALKHVSKMS
ncbi:MAG: hypothetical protein M8364_16350 [Methylobacter sp.]|uniref:hypothetical protein n=1 Tax=Methylobacter sp. TaxID=2051955 RepID=UPI00258EA045|nr:hypothetical protein [Methylobacter sp.]MCL7422462.1 hypothetical protein [Methylobacter sp.]